MNPAVTLAFTLLGKLEPGDAVGYITGQFAGGIVGVLGASLVAGRALAHPAVRFVVTQPGAGPRAARVAFAAEFAISFILFLTILILSNTPVSMAYTPWAAGALVFLYITFEAPLSGMSLNPARTLGSAVIARSFRALPIYFIAPPLGMVAAAAVYASVLGTQAVHCAKLDHRGDVPCPFRCTIDALRHPRQVDGIESPEH